MSVRLVVEGLSKRYDTNHALAGLSFEAPAGQVLALLGPNGAGKSTALRCVAGLLTPDAGTVQLVDDDGRLLPARGSVSFMPEFPDLYGGITVAEHVRFIALAYRVADWRDRSADLLSRFSLTDRADALPDELSQGMKRKLALVMALLHGARVVLLDEPFNGLDPRAVRELRELVRELTAGGVTVVLSTHRLEETEKLTDRIAVMDRGRAVAQGALPELQRAARLGQDADLETVFLKLTEEAEAEGVGAGEDVEQRTSVGRGDRHE